MPVSLAQFIQQLSDSGILSADDIRSFQEGLPPDKRSAGDAQEFARELVRQKKLTSHQATVAYQGIAHTLLYGNYVVLDKLGQGGMGVVFKARHRRMNRVVALKVMSPNAMKSPDAVKRFRREVEAAARLTHPNIVAAFDADESRGVHFLVMEYVDGTDLAAQVKKHGPLPVAKAIGCILQAARGLAHAHAEGVVHRDIKPANLLIDKQGTVKILDMGLARITAEPGQAADGLTQTGSIMGTVDFMSPEQALHTKHADQRADVYSLGCSLFYLLTGRPVFPGESLMEKLLAHREKPIPALSAVRPGAPPALDAVFVRMVAKRCEDRFQSMNDVISDLEKVLAGAEVAPAGAALSNQGVGHSPLESAWTPDRLGETGDSAVQDFLQAITPAAGESLSRPRSARAGGDMSTNRTAGKTRVSALESIVGRVSQSSPAQRWLIAGGVGALFLAIGLYFGFRGGDGKSARSSSADPADGARSVAKASGKKEPQSSAKPSQAATWTQLFSTGDLQGWRGLPGLWTAGNGTLTGSTGGKRMPHNTFLCSDRTYRDFELEFSVRLAGGTNNSGVQIRSLLDDAGKFIVAGPQADIGGQFWGSLYGEKTVGMMKQSPASVLGRIKPDEFNEYFIRCAGKHVQIRVNGEKTVDDDFPDMADEGIVAWQIHSGEPMEVVFRDVRLRELSPGRDATPAPGPWVELFNGRDFTGWVNGKEGPPRWKIKDGYMEIVPSSGWLTTTESFGPDLDLHAEFWIPKMAQQQGQARGNSGLYLLGRHEIQILDMVDNPNVQPKTGCGALFGMIAPKPGGVRDPETWQTFDMTLRSPRPASKGKPATPGRLTVVHNGVRVIDDVEFDAVPSGGALNTEIGAPGPIALQDHGAAVRFRGLRVRNLPPARSSMIAPADGEVDLLADIDPRRDAVQGKWTPAPTGLRVTSAPAAPPAVFTFPLEVAGDYDVRLDFVRLDGKNSVNVLLPIGTGAATFILAGFPDRPGGPQTGLSGIDGQALPNLPSAVRGITLENDRLYQLAISVRTKGDEVTVTSRLADREIFTWSGKAKRLKPGDFYKLPDPLTTLGLGVVNSSFEFRRIRFSITRGKANWRESATSVGAAPK